jgi:sialic acid synthase SpsE
VSTIKRKIMKIKIGEREIGDGCEPFIIAEVGSNWTSLEDCLHSIRQAKACGADAVKFQAYDWEALYGVPFGPGVTKIAGQLPIDWLPHLKSECDYVGIEFMCSAFSPELVEAVDPFVNVHKVASAEMTHVRILEKLMEIGKPVILSTGASGVKDIVMALGTLGDTPVVLMYCESSYPATEIHFGKLVNLKQLGTLVGYSDHSTDVLVIPVVSTAYGACVIEKHVTFIDAETPDSGHSLNGEQFKKMIDHLNGGTVGHIGPSQQEKPMVLRHNRRLIATCDIAAGDTFRENENFGIYRSLKDDTHAFSPFAINQVNGKTALKAIRAGDGIGPGDV